MRSGTESGFPRGLFLSELAGTALLVFVGISWVALLFGAGSPLPRLVPGEGTRRAIAGFLFGGTGALIAVSPVGQVSGAHINPAVTLGFWLMGKISAGTLGVYAAAQLLGGVLGAVPLLFWGRTGRSVAFGATTPGEGWSAGSALLGETCATFAMVTLLCVFIGFRPLRPFTPALFPPLFAFLVWAEAPVSGTSCNPARSLGPALVSGEWRGWWVYWAGPLLGAFLATLACSAMAKRIQVAKLYHFDSAHDRLARRRLAPPTPEPRGTPALDQ